VRFCGIPQLYAIEKRASLFSPALDCSARFHASIHCVSTTSYFLGVGKLSKPLVVPRNVREYHHETLLSVVNVVVHEVAKVLLVLSQTQQVPSTAFVDSNRPYDRMISVLSCFMDLSQSGLAG
jgi:hypothetical protein